MKRLHVARVTRLLPVAVWMMTIWAAICAAPCLAGTAYTWNTTDGNWNNAGNWDIGIPPAGNQTDLYFPNDPAVTYTSTNDFGGERVIESIILSGGAAPATGTNVIAGNPVDVRNSANQISNRNSSTVDWDIQIDIGLYPPNVQLRLTGDGTTPAVISGNIRKAAAGNSSPNRGITKSGSTTWIITGDIESTIDGPINITAGTLDLRGTGNAYTGSTTVSGGTLVAGAANVIPYGAGKGNITVNGSGTFNLDGGNQNINGLAGNGTVEITGTANRTLTIGHNNATATFSGVIQNTGSGNLTLFKVGTGTQTLSGANTYGGETNLDLGTTVITNQNAFSTGLVNMRTIGGTDTVLELDANGMTIANDFFIRNPYDNRTIRLDRAGTNTATMSGGFTVNEQTPGTFTLDVGEDDTLSLTGDIITTGGGGAGITKTGTGTLTLSGTNNYLGATTVDDGTLAAGAANVIPSGSGKGNLVVNGSGTFNLNGGNQSINGLAGSGTVEITGTSSRTLTVGNGNATATFSGVIRNTGSGNLTFYKIGTGTQTLSGANTYSGTTNLDLGTTVITNENAFSTGLVNMRTIGGTDTVLELDADGMTIANDFFIRNPYDNRTIRLDRAGTNTATMSGGFTVNEQTPGTFTLDVGEDDSLSLTGDIITTGGGGAGITKTGTGTLTLSGTNNYLGATTVSDGTLLVDGTHIGGSAYIVDGGTLGGTGTIGAPVTVNAATLSPGASIGTLATGALTLGASSNSLFELSAPWQFGVSSGTTPNDLVNVTGDLALDGTLTVEAVSLLSSGVYTLFTATGSITGDFQGLSFPGGYGGWITIDSGNGAVNLNLVPEPSTLAMLLGLGGIGLLGWLRRRRKS